ncbi:CLUMA_CG018143, isoform A [Clunio marinus]|uniref:trypsin n=1 Tax=Clunio marinus TaxID=568069 RepID=A0A1J1IYA3_9DIPT|nr:CLUMA_CG018143, isoform A [Clunio marinus]
MLKVLVFVILGIIAEHISEFLAEDTKIVGGKEVEIKNAPFIVALMSNGRHLCGGSIISKNFILTAAHCTISSKPKELTIQSGSSHKGNGDINYVSHIYNHPQYKEINFDYDFALLKIFGKMFYNENRKAIMLPDEDDETPAGEYARALGWGNTMNPLESSDYLRGVDLMIISYDECKEAYKVYGLEVEHNKVCAIHPDRVDGKDSCQGDSGGPLQRLSDGKLIGVVSFGLGCANVEYAGVYSRVSSVRPWIKSIAHV